MSKRINQVQRVLSTDIEQFEKMSRAELAKEVSILASAGNKRIKRLAQQGFTGDLSTPAVFYTMRHGGKFSVAGKDKTQLLNEMKRIKGFLGAKTSTLFGAKQSIAEMNAMLGRMGRGQDSEDPANSKPYEMTKEELREYWRAVDRIRELQPSTFNAICLQYVGKIEKYIEKGRTGRQAASYINRAMEKLRKESMDQISKMEAELARYTANDVGDNNLGSNNL